MVELVRAGRKPTQLAREFSVTAQSISTWVAQAAADSGKPARIKDVLSNAEREELARLRRENRQLKASGYYAWRDRPRCERVIDNAGLTDRIRIVHAASDATYGMPRVRAELIDQGLAVSRQRVARLMRAAHIRGVSRRRAFVVTTQRDKDKQPAPDLVKREFKVDGPNQLWVADMTYVPAWAGFIYLAVVFDVWRRRIVGWAIGEQMTAELVLSALNMALQQRKPKVSSTTATRAASTPASHSESAARRWACGPRWARSAMPTTTRWPRASSPRSSAS